MRLRLLLFFLLALCIFAGPSAGAQEPAAGPLPAPKVASARMNNDSIVRMVKAGLSEDLILQTISSQPAQFSVDSDSLVALKQAGVSDRVIDAIVNKSRTRLSPEPEVVLSEVNEIGVYYRDPTGKWQPIEPEIVHIKSGGFIKSTLSQGIIKEDRNGHINGRESKLLLPRPVDILVYTPEGVDIAEYDLLRFRLNSNSREFRTLTGGIIHSSGGAERDEVAFHPRKTAPRTYTFTLDQSTPGGEYGVLPPGTGNVTNGGKIYTFAVTQAAQ